MVREIKSRKIRWVNMKGDNYVHCDKCAKIWIEKLNKEVESWQTLKTKKD